MKSIYVRAIEALKPLGIPLEMAVMQFAEAVKLLEGASLVEAARYYAKHQPHKVPRKTVGDGRKLLAGPSRPKALAHTHNIVCAASDGDSNKT